MKRTIALAAFLTGLALAGSGCGDNKTTLAATGTATIAQANPIEVVLIGRVVEEDPSDPNGRPLAGVPNATVSVEVTPLDVRSATTIAESGNRAGEFEIRGIFPTEPRIFHVRVRHPSFADRDFCVFIPARARGGVGASQVHVVDMRRLPLSRPANLNVFVRLDGQVEAGARVFAIDNNALNGTFDVLFDLSDLQEYTKFQDFFLGSVTSDGSFRFSPDCTAATEFLATTDSNGLATLSGLASNRRYTLVVPGRDKNGDGRYEYGTETTSQTPSNITTTVAFDMDSQTITNGVQRIGDNLVDTRSSMTFSTGPIVDTGTAIGNPTFQIPPQTVNDAVVEQDSISNNKALLGPTMTQVFRFPVEVVPTGSGSGEPRFEFVNDLVDPRTDSTFMQRKRINATAQRFADGTVWVFTPASALPENEFFTLEYKARNPNTSTSLIPVTSSVFYRPRTVGGLTSLFTPTLDNYNGQTVSATAASTQVFLEFPEVVFGFYQVLQITDGTTVTQVDNPVANFIDNNGDDDLVFADNEENTFGGAQDNQNNAQTGTGAAPDTIYRVRLRDGSGNLVSRGDHTAGAPVTVKVHLSVEDIEGNRVEGTFDLNVQ